MEEKEKNSKESDRMTTEKIKVLTKLGLMFIPPEEREARLKELMEGNTINGPALARLIDDCLKNCYEMTENTGTEENTGAEENEKQNEKQNKKVSEHEKIQIRWMLQNIDGRKAVANMEPEEVYDFVKSVRSDRFSTSELLTVAKAMMSRE